MDAAPLPVIDVATPVALLSYADGSPEPLPRYAHVGRGASLAALALGMVFFIICNCDATRSYEDACRACVPLLQAFCIGFGFAFYALARRQHGRLNSTYALWLTMNVTGLALIVIELLLEPHYKSIGRCVTLTTSI